MIAIALAAQEGRTSVVVPDVALVLRHGPFRVEVMLLEDAEIGAAVTT